MLIPKGQKSWLQTSIKLNSNNQFFSKTAAGFPIKPQKLSVEFVRGELSPSATALAVPGRHEVKKKILNSNMSFQQIKMYSRPVSPRGEQKIAGLAHSLSCKYLPKRKESGAQPKEKCQSQIRQVLREKAGFFTPTPKRNVKGENISKQNLGENIQPGEFGERCGYFFRKKNEKQKLKAESSATNVLLNSKSDGKMLTFTKKPLQNQSGQIRKYLVNFNACRIDPPPGLTKGGSNNEQKHEKWVQEMPSRNSCRQFLNRSINSTGVSVRCSLNRPQGSQRFVGRIEEFILGGCKGEGRYGKVYQAIHKKSGWMLAIKKIRKQSVRPIMDQFLNQIKIQITLDHPNIVKLFGYFSDQQHIYLLLEYMEEGSLFRYIKNKQKLEEEETKQKLGDVCEAISFMHRNDFLHRDIKPENIVMSHGVCKICDFGWSASSKTKRKTCCGTLDYTCPEVASGSSYTKQIDVWAVGVLAYQMMVGKPPFYHFSRQQTMTFIRNVVFL